MKTITVLLILNAFYLSAFSQGKYVTTNAQIHFISEAPLENIKAVSEEARGGIDIETNKILFIVPVKSFEFRKKLMQKHFNEQYLESDKFPIAKFEGFFESPVDFTVKEKQELEYTGKITIHGVSKDISGIVSMNILNDQIISSSVLNLRTKDFDIKIPRLLIKNIAEEVEVRINAVLKPNQSIK